MVELAVPVFKVLQPVAPFFEQVQNMHICHSLLFQRKDWGITLYSAPRFAWTG